MSLDQDVITEIKAVKWKGDRLIAYALLCLAKETAEVASALRQQGAITTALRSLADTKSAAADTQRPPADLGISRGPLSPPRP